MNGKQYDVLVVGGGPAGYVAAIRAGQLGLKTAVVEKEHLGGVCLNWGCIPTKALLRTADIAHALRMAGDFGFGLEKKPKFNLKKAVKRSRDISSKLSKGIAYLLKKNEVEHIPGYARLKGNGAVEIINSGANIDPLNISAKNIILATGARARRLPGLNGKNKNIWTAKEAMVPEKLPASMVILGSGAIGIEFASFYKSVGVNDITIVEVQERILPAEDPEISAMAQKIFEKQGIKIHTSTTLEKLSSFKDGVGYNLVHKGEVKEEKAEIALLAIGIEGNIEDIGLENTKVRTEKGHIMTHGIAQTDEPGVYAIGDVASAPWLAHKASHEAIACVEYIAGVGKNHSVDPTKVPGCTYSIPQIASVGYTEPESKASGYDVAVGRFYFQANGKALSLGEPEGMVKVIFDKKTGELLGAHMIGAEVTEMIQGFVIARALEATEEDLMQVIFPHPTLSEMMHEAILDAFDKAIHH